MQDFHIFVFQSDFEDIFESQLASRVQFHGGKVEKAMQLENFLPIMKRNNGYLMNYIGLLKLFKMIYGIINTDRILQ